MFGRTVLRNVFLRKGHRGTVFGLPAHSQTAGPLQHTPAFGLKPPLGYEVQ